MRKGQKFLIAQVSSGTC